MDTADDNVQLRILLIDDQADRAALLEQALTDTGHTVVARLTTNTTLFKDVCDYEPDIIIIDLESPDRDTLEHMQQISQHQPKPIIMFAEDDDSDVINKAIKAGVSAYVVDGLSSQRIKPVMDVAIARFREYQALRDELTRARVSLEERKLIDKAKALLIKHKGMNEEEAHRALRKLAMDQSIKLPEAARNIISVLNLLG